MAEGLGDKYPASPWDRIIPPSPRTVSAIAPNPPTLTSWILYAR